MPTTYPGRDYLAPAAEGGRHRVDSLAAATLAALDHLAQRLDALAAVELDGAPCIACGLPEDAHLIDPDHAEDWQPQHTYEQPDPVVPSTWPVQPLHTDAEGPNVATCGTCWRKWDDGAVTELTPTPAARCPFEPFHVDPDDLDAIGPEGDRARAAANVEADAFEAQAEAEHIAQHPTGADIETGRDLANDAEQYGAESDARDVAHMIAQALAAARADGYRRGIEAARR